MTICTSCAANLPHGANFCPKCGAVQQRPEEGDDLIGKTLGSYHIVARLGEGAMGRVYRAVQTTLGREVCVKTLHPHLSAEASLVQRFQREAAAASGLRHPNIVGVLDFGRTVDDLLYIVMEFIDGRELRDVIAQDSPLSVQRALTITDQILSALEEAHGAGIVHRDLKPENVLVVRLRDGRDLAKIVDFGIAKMAESKPDQPRLTATGMAIGTPGYMAPEQILGHKVDQRVDVYAAGVILYEMLTGRPPFVGRTVEDLLQRHLSASAEPPSIHAPLPLPDGLDEIVLHALQRSRDRRYGAALEFKRALEAVQTGLKVQTAEPPPPPPAHPAPSVTHPTESSPGSHPVETLRSLMPEQLVEHLADMPSMLAGEKRHVTVLIAELTGFSEVGESIDPEEVHETRNRCFDGLVEAVEHFEGFVDKYFGNRMMVLFGAPRAHEDDPERAVRCALRMRASLEELAETLSGSIELRIGIQAGEAVVGGVGGRRRMEYSVTGKVVDMAEWLVSQAQGGSILVGDAVQQLTSERVAFKPARTIAVRGRAKPLRAHEVLRVVRAAGSSALLLGRDGDLATIYHLLQGVAGGRAGGMLVIGRPGMGKTCFLAEAARIGAEAGLRVIRGRGGRFGTPAHLELIREMVFDLCGGLPRDAEDADRKLQSLARHGLDPHQVRRLRHLFGGEAGEGAFEQEESQLLARTALRRLFLHAPEEPGTCVVIDDVHLADPDSRAFLRELVTAAQGHCFAIVVSARTVESEGVLPRLGRLILEPLTRDVLLEIVRHELGDQDGIDPVIERVADHAEGNPLFAREIVRSLVASRAILLQGETWVWRAGDESLPVPDSLRLLARARFDDLSPAARSLLQHAAVAGRTFGLDLIARAVSDEVGDVRAAIDECVRSGFLIPAEDVEAGYRFRVAVSHEAVLADLTKAAQQQIHQRIAGALETGLTMAGRHPAEALAHHLLSAGQTEKGAHFLTLSADWLAERYAFEAAAQRHARALELTLERLASDGGEVAAGAADDLLGLAARTAGSMGMVEPERALALLDRALQHVPRGHRSLDLARARQQRGQLLLKLSRPGEAEEALIGARGCLTGRDEPELEASLAADLAAAHEATGEYVLASNQLLDGLQRLWGAPPRDPDLMWRFLNQLGRIHLRAGETARAREFFENALDQAKQTKRRVGEARVATNLASLLAMEGDSERAEQRYEEALELSASAGDSIGVARVHANVGRLFLQLGRQDEAAERLQASLSLASEVGWREGIATASQALDSVKTRG